MAGTASDAAKLEPAMESVPGAQSVLASSQWQHDGSVRKRTAMLPDWMKRFTLHDLQSLSKASIAVWITTILIFIDPVLQNFGQAIFFGCITLFFLPADGPFPLQVLGHATIILGMGIAWAWGVIASKAALATRTSAETNARLLQLQQASQTNTTNSGAVSGQTTYTQVLVYEGFMLDTRITATFFCMIVPLIYLTARLRAKLPKTALLAIYAWIISDIYLTIGPLIPSFQGTLPQTLLKPTAAAIAVGLACNLIIFPKSTSFIACEAVIRTMNPMSEFLRSMSDSLTNDGNTSLTSPHLDLAQERAFTGWQELQTALPMISLDLSFGRWGPADVKSFASLLQPVLLSFADLVRFEKERNTTREQVRSAAPAKGASAQDSHSSFTPQQVAQAFLELKDGKLVESARLAVSEEMRHLSDAGAKDLLLGCAQAIDDILRTLRSINRARLRRTEPSLQLARLSDVLALLEKHRSRLDSQSSEDEKTQQQPSARRIDADQPQSPVLLAKVLSLSLRERFVHISVVLESMLRHMIELENVRSKNKLWLPQLPATSHLNRLARRPLIEKHAAYATANLEGTDAEHKMQRSHTKTSGHAMASASASSSSLPHTEEIFPHARPRKRSPLAGAILLLTTWLFNEEGMFALRVAVVTVATAIPAVIMSSAGFYYRERGLWALIMAQTGLALYTADFVDAFVQRLLGTIVGGVIGLVCWYIGAGNGSGNPYGMAAVMVPVILVFMYLRLFAPPNLLQTTVLTIATVYLVLAYSWVDTRIPTYGNPGIGYNVFWRRILLVLIGFAASMVVLLFPRPPSASRRYRYELADTLRSAGQLYTSWGQMSRDETRGSMVSDFSEHTSTRVLKNVDLLTSLSAPVALLRFELSSTGFTAASVGHISRISSDVNLAVLTMVQVAAHSPDNVVAQFMHDSGALQHDVVGDVMAIVSIASYCLESGRPIAGTLPGPLLRKFAGANYVSTSARTSSDSTSTRSLFEKSAAGRYSILLIAFLQLLSSVDELLAVVKQVVGEQHDPFLQNSAVAEGRMA